MVARLFGSALAMAVATLSACATASHTPPATTVARDGKSWADSVLTTLSLRDKAAQMVWPWVLGDYTAADDPTYRRVERLVREQHLGGIIISGGR